MRRSEDFKRAAVLLNTAISAYTHYSRVQLKEIFKSCNLPNSTEYFMCLQEMCILVPTSTKFKYRFTRTPLNFTELETAARKAVEKQKGYLKNPGKKRVVVKRVVVDEDITEKAIALLKAKGYLILKQI